jgi:hypothetical protein
MAAINEYKKKEEIYMARVAELDAMTAARDEQKKYHDDLRWGYSDNNLYPVPFGGFAEPEPHFLWSRSHLHCAMWLLPRLLLIFPRLRNTARLSVFFN